MCEWGLVHPRAPPLQYASYASLAARAEREAGARAAAKAKAEGRAEGRAEGETAARRARAPGTVGDGSGLDDNGDDGSDEEEPWDGRLSIFGEALLDAFTGAAADPDEADISGSPEVSARSLCL